MTTAHKQAASKLTDYRLTLTLMFVGSERFAVVFFDSVCNGQVDLFLMFNNYCVCCSLQISNVQNSVRCILLYYSTMILRYMVQKDD